MVRVNVEGGSGVPFTVGSGGQPVISQPGTIPGMAATPTFQMQPGGTATQVGGTGGPFDQQAMFDALAAQFGGSSGGGFQQGFGDTETGFYELLGLSNQRLQEDISFNQAQVDNWSSQLASADANTAARLQFDIDRLEDTLGFQYDQLDQGQSQFDLGQEFQREQLTQQGEQFGATEERLLAGQANQHQIALGQLDLQGQSLAIQARQAELQAQVAAGQLELGQAQLTLTREIESGRLQLSQETLEQRKFEFGENFSLQQEIQRATVETQNRLAAVSEGQLGVSQGQLALSEKEQRERLAFDKSALISERFGRDPTRQAFAQLGLETEGLLTPEDVALQGFGAGAPSAGPVGTDEAVLVGEESPEVVVPNEEEGFDVLPIVGAAQFGGTFNKRGQTGAQQSMEAIAGRSSLSQQLRAKRQRMRAAAASAAEAETVDLTTTAPPVETPPVATAPVATTPTATVPTAPVPTAPAITTPAASTGPSSAQIAAANVARATGSALGLDPGTLSLSREQGFTGLPTVQKAATAFQQSGIPIQTLLSSAFGLGNKVTGGVNRDEFIRRIQDVTPGGSLTF